jgi:hypothetical protein
MVNYVYRNKITGNNKGELTMTKNVNITFDLYIRKSDLIKLENGEEVTGYKTVNNPNEFELVSKYAFLPAIKINDNEYSVCTINK